MPAVWSRFIILALVSWVFLTHLAGCIAIPVHHAAEVDKLRAEGNRIHVGQSTREDVHAALGEPWLKSDFWRVDLYRAEGRDVNLFFLLYVPVWIGDSEEASYLLIAYDTAGLVSQISTSTSGPSFVRLRADDLTFRIEGRRGSHLMADGTRLQAYLETQHRSPSCTLLLACGETSYPKWSDEIRPYTVVVDDTEPLNLSPFWFQGSCSSENPCPPKYLVLEEYTLLPLIHSMTLPPGNHHLALKSSVSESRWETDFDCGPGDVLYGTIRGNETGDRSTSMLDATVTLSKIAPTNWESYSILLYQRGRWVVAPEPDQR